MDYYPSDRTAGGIAYTASFKDGEVSMACEQPINNTVTGKTYPVGTEVKSFYRIVSETGVLLTFDTYNALFHYWSQPVSGRMNGFKSDYEFTFVSACKDSVVLRGKKYGNVLRMYPTAESGVNYVKQVQLMRHQLSQTTRKRAVVDGQQKMIAMTDGQIKFSEAGVLKKESYLYTPTGIRFYEPITLGGVSVRSLTYDKAADELASAEKRMVLPTPNTVERFIGTNTQWYFGFDKSTGASDMCDDLFEIVTSINRSMKSADWGYEALQGLYIGYNLADADTDTQRMVIGWTARDNYGGGNYVYFGYGIDMNHFDIERRLISIETLTGTTNFDKHVYCQKMVDFIGQYSPYLITFNNDDDPTEVTLTSDADATKWFKLKKK